jgi:glucosamine--fructose-6-phosphate aminotransferase (isomerizing)
MCGIVAYLGEKEAQPLLIEALRRLEYRGYDSSGLATLNGKGLYCLKKKGRIQELEIAARKSPAHGKIGISHTRWATHGEPSDRTAHPHVDQSGKMALVHNGVVENYQSLKKGLVAKGHTFVSDTDTEVLTHLVGDCYDQLPAETPHRLEQALKNALRKVRGTYGVAIIHQDHPRVLVGARRGSPLALGIGDDEFFLTSDMAAVIAYTQKAVFLNDHDVVEIAGGDFRITTLDSEENVGYQISQVELAEASAELGQFPHYMLKEIFEQPEALRNTFRGRLNLEDATAQLGGLNMTAQELRGVERIVITACGTALHAGMVGEYLIESLAQIPVETDNASEFRYRNCPMDGNTLVFVVSQSGETADTLGAVREARRKGFRTLGVVNRVGSSIARETDGGVYMHAGNEIGVAATKSFISQVMVFTLIALMFGRLRNLSAGQGREIIEAIESLPALIEKILQQNEAIRKIAAKYKDKKSMLFLGRLYQRPIALEGALKMKEISYIHAEGYPSAELKHGVLALVDEHTPSVFLCPNDSMYDKNLSNMQEVKARHGQVIAVATEGDTEIAKVADDVIYVPEAPEYVLPMLTVIPLQLLSYHTSHLLGRDVDKPRNLAKSVTVE